MKKNKRLYFWLCKRFCLFLLLFGYLILCNFDGYVHVYEANTDKVENFRCSNKGYCIAVDVSLFFKYFFLF